MMYLGDIPFAGKVYRSFTSINTVGVPASLAGSPAIVVRKDDGTAPSSAGITLVTDLNSVVGLNSIKIDTSADATFYASGHDYFIEVSSGTVNTLSLVGYVLGGFSIENRSALRPTTAGRTLGVNAGGQAGIDWANVGNPTTTLGLSGTTIKDATDIETKLGSPAGASVSADLAAVKTDTSTLTGRLTSGRATNLDNLDAAITTRAAAATALSTVQWTNARAALIDNLDAAITTRAPSATALSTVQWTNARAALLDFLDVAVSTRSAAATALSTAQWTNVRAALLDNLDATVSSRAAAATALSTAQWTNVRAALLDFLDVAVSSRLATAGYTAPDNTDIAAIKAKTDNLPADPASESQVESKISDVKNLVVAGL